MHEFLEGEGVLAYNTPGTDGFCAIWIEFPDEFIGLWIKRTNLEYLCEID